MAPNERNRPRGGGSADHSDGQEEFTSPWIISRLVPCPDCPADVELLHHGDGGLHIEIKHEPSCPTWVAKQKAVGL